MQRKKHLSTMRNTSYTENVLVNNENLIINTFFSNTIFLLFKSAFKYNIQRSENPQIDTSMDFHKVSSPV